MLKNIFVLILLSSARVCYGLDIDDDADFKYHPQLDGCLKLHRQPTEWLNAWSSCLREGAQLASPWTYEFVSAVSELQSGETKIPVLYSGARIVLPPYNGGDFWTMQAKEDWQRCGVWYANGTSDEVDCKERLPFVCFAPVASAAAPNLATTSVPASTCVLPTREKKEESM